MQIIGFAGRAGSGKDSAARFIDENRDTLFPNLERTIYLYYAAPMKDIARDYFGVSEGLLWGTQEDKLELTEFHWEDLPWYDAIKREAFDKASSDMFEQYIWDTIPQKDMNRYRDDMYEKYLPKGVMTVRDLLNQIGERMILPLYPNVWIDYFAKSLAAFSSKSVLVLVPDIRKREQVQQIQSLGGKVIHLARAVNTIENESENGLAGFRGYDFSINNQEMAVGETQEEIRKAVSFWGKDSMESDARCENVSDSY